MKTKKRNKLWLNNLMFFAMGAFCTVTVMGAGNNIEKPVFEPDVYISNDDHSIVIQAPAPATEEITIPENPIVEDLIEEKNADTIVPKVVPVVYEEEQPNIVCSEDDICLIATVTMAEAEGECEEGQRYVIDTILNRVDDPHFPNSIEEVVYQPNQFTCMWNGRIDRCTVRDDIYELVLEELENRTNDVVIFFNANHYSAYGVPYKQIEHHYFSTYE